MSLTINLTDTNCTHVWSLCALPDDVLLIACGRAGLRAVSLNSTQLSAHKPPTIRNVYKVAFDKHTDTLLLIVAYNDIMYSLVSLRRNASEWLEVMRLSTNLSTDDDYAPVIAVCDSHVLLADGGNNTVYVFNVNAEHSVIRAGSVSVENEFYRLACTRREGDTLVALANTSSVQLHRLTSAPLRLDMLSKVDLEYPSPSGLLFFGGVLLVAHWNNSNEYAIVSLRVSGNLTEPRVLFNTRAYEGEYLAAVWALACERLVYWDFRSLGHRLLVYAFE